MATSRSAPSTPGAAGRTPADGASLRPAVDLPQVPPLDAEAMAAARIRWDGRAKPQGALGRIEDLAVRLAGITGACPPPVPERPAVLVFAGDHGVVADGASAWPSEVTGLMVRVMADGAAAVSSFAASVGARVRLVDVGVAGDLSSVPGVVGRKVRAGTASLAQGPAMTVDEAAAALLVGREEAGRLVDEGADLLAVGEMGIGNTTPSACLVAHLCGRSAAEVTGRGAGVDDAGLERKRALVGAALARVEGVTGPVEVLAELGGLEIAAMAGCYVEAAVRRVPVVVDGVIGLAALLAADALAPGTADRVVASHRPVEPAGGIALERLGHEPLLDLGLRLGEGTGAVLAVPIVQAAAAALAGMAALPA